MKTILSLATLSLAITITGCGGGGGDAEEGGDGASTTGGETPAEYAGPVSDTADAMAGAETFDQVCGACHPGSAPDIAGIGWTAAAVRQQVREGDGEMPPFAETRVSAEDLENILAHMASTGGVS